MKKSSSQPQKEEFLEDENEDIELSETGEVVLPPLIQPSRYEVQFLRADKKKFFRRQKLFLWFQIITPGEFHGNQLYLVCDITSRKKWHSSSKFLQTWVLAVGKKPDRYDRMSTKVFRGKVFLADVVTVTKNARGWERPPALQYSVIRGLVRRLTDSYE
ncbi:MAG: hypothetical protein R3B74_11655 [Nitrospirales bacterium]|nr:hypothetical protein [Nitrospirales bacterium]